MKFQAWKKNELVSRLTDLLRKRLEKQTALANVVQQPSTLAIVSLMIENVNITFACVNESFFNITFWKIYFLCMYI